MKNIDIYSEDLTYFKNSQRSFKSNFGGVLSIIKLISTLAIFLGFFIPYFQESSRIVTKVETFDTNSWEKPLIKGLVRAKKSSASKLWYHYTINNTRNVNFTDDFVCSDTQFSEIFSEAKETRSEDYFYWCFNFTTGGRYSVKVRCIDDPKSYCYLNFDIAADFDFYFLSQRMNPEKSDLISKHVTNFEKNFTNVSILYYNLNKFNSPQGPVYFTDISFIEYRQSRFVNNTVSGSNQAFAALFEFYSKKNYVIEVTADTFKQVLAKFVAIWRIVSIFIFIIFSLFSNYLYRKDFLLGLVDKRIIFNEISQHIVIENEEHLFQIYCLKNYFISRFSRTFNSDTLKFVIVDEAIKNCLNIENLLVKNHSELLIPKTEKNVCSKFLSILDFYYAESPVLRVRKGYKFKNIFGAFLSVITLGLSIVIFIFVGKDFWEKVPRKNDNSESLFRIKDFNLTNDYSVPILISMSASFANFTNPRYIKRNVNPGGFLPLDGRWCSDSDFDNFNISIAQRENASLRHYCTNFNRIVNPNILDPSDRDTKEAHIYFANCTEEYTTCNSPPANATPLFFSLRLKLKQFTENYDTPFKDYFLDTVVTDRQYTYIDTEAQSQTVNILNDLTIRKIQIDKGWFVSDIENHYIVESSYLTPVNQENPRLPRNTTLTNTKIRRFFSVSVRINEEYTLTTRVYMKIDEMLALCFSVISLMMIGFSILNSFFSEFFYLKHMLKFFLKSLSVNEKNSIIEPSKDMKEISQISKNRLEENRENSELVSVSKFNPKNKRKDSELRNLDSLTSQRIARETEARKLETINNKAESVKKSGTINSKRSVNSQNASGSNRFSRFSRANSDVEIMETKKLDLSISRNVTILNFIKYKFYLMKSEHQFYTLYQKFQEALSLEKALNCETNKNISTIAQFDLFDKKDFFHISSHKKIRTPLGGFLTIIAFYVIIICCYFFSSNLRNSTVIYTKINRKSRYNVESKPDGSGQIFVISMPKTILDGKLSFVFPVINWSFDYRGSEYKCLDSQINEILGSQPRDPSLEYICVDPMTLLGNNGELKIGWRFCQNEFMLSSWWSNCPNGQFPNNFVSTTVKTWFKYYRLNGEFQPEIKWDNRTFNLSTSTDYRNMRCPSAITRNYEIFDNINRFGKAQTENYYISVEDVQDLSWRGLVAQMVPKEYENTKVFLVYENLPETLAKILAMLDVFLFLIQLIYSNFFYYFYYKRLLAVLIRQSSFFDSVQRNINQEIVAGSTDVEGGRSKKDKESDDAMRVFYYDNVYNLTNFLKFKTFFNFEHKAIFQILTDEIEKSIEVEKIFKKISSK